MALQAMSRFWSRCWSSFSSVVATRSLNRCIYCAKWIHRRNILVTTSCIFLMGTILLWSGQRALRKPIDNESGSTF